MASISNRKYLKEMPTATGGQAVYQTEEFHCVSNVVSVSELPVQIPLCLTVESV